MPRNDGNKPRKEMLKILVRTEKNLRRAKFYLNEFASELSPESLSNLRNQISCKIKTLEQSKGTFQGY